MSIHMRSSLFSTLLQSFKLHLSTTSMGKKLQTRSQALVLRGPARSLPSTSPVIVAGIIIGTSVSMLISESALCEKVIMLAAAEGPFGSDDGPKKKKNDPVKKYIDVVMERCGEPTMAGSLGFCSGYALKQAGKAAAVAVGLIFVVAQVATYNGYIDINWSKMQKDMTAKVDPNGNGKIDSQDVQLWYRKLLQIIKTKLPSSAGFSTGFALGIYYS